MAILNLVETRDSAKPATRRLKATFWLDVALLLFFCALETVPFTGLVLNLSLFAAMTALIFSGILISQYAIPALTGAKPEPEMDWRWDSIHNRLSDFVVVLAGLHLAINWEWALAAGRKILRREGGL